MEGCRREFDQERKKGLLFMIQELAWERAWRASNHILQQRRICCMSGKSMKGSQDSESVSEKGRASINTHHMTEACMEACKESCPLDSCFE